MERRLAAILAADVVGYTRLMEQDEAEAFTRLRAHRKDLFEPEIAAHRGRIFKLMGDGLLAEYASVVDAVECAVTLQRKLAERETDVPQDRQIRVRIGVNLGDVIVDDDDRLGEGVNIAARLQQLADPGGIAVSATVHSHIRNKVDFAFESLGEQRLKNLDEAVTVFRVLFDGSPRAEASSRADSFTDSGSGSGATLPPEAILRRPAVVILPFLNLSGDPAQEYFVDGMTEDLITALAQWRWFPVIARNSAFAYKGRAVDVTQVGRELNARYVLQGSLRLAGDRVRINAQLIDAGNGHHLWAQTYDRRLGDIFDLQDEITRAIVVAIEPQIAQAEQRRAARARPESLDAWDMSLQALAQIRQGSASGLVEAKRLLGQATALDPTSSYAQSLLALAEFQGALAGWTRDPAGMLGKTLAAAETAVALDDGDWLAHALLGIATLWVRRAYDKAILEEELALALNPSASIAYHFLGCALTFDGQAAAAVPKLAAILDIDPRFAFLPVTLADLGLAKLLIGEPMVALGFIERSLAEQPNNVRAWQRKTVVLAHLGRIEEAQGALAQLLRLQPSFSAGYVSATYPFRDPAHAAIFADGLRKAGWREGAAPDMSFTAARPTP
jgi:adenylate cyclase